MRFLAVVVVVAHADAADAAGLVVEGEGEGFLAVFDVRLCVALVKRRNVVNAENLKFTI